MANCNARAEVVSEIAMLRNQQFASEIEATYVGWTLKAKMASERRASRIALLVGELNDFDRPEVPKDGASRRHDKRA